ncbi:RNA methyltransferase [Synechococcus sp. CBW1107]|nr:RNA methyltransferase [Synechococcus sp. CBW1107]
MITSRRNPLVGRLRTLHQSRGRREQNLLLLEGTHLLEEALRLGLRPRQVLASPVWIERQRSLLEAHPWMAAVLQPVAQPVLEAVATTTHPDGVVLTLPWPEPPAGEGAEFVLALDRLQDPGNLGTLMRTALAAGVEELWLAEGADPFQPKVLRASAGAALALPCRRLEQLLPRLESARRGGAQVVASVVAGGLPYWQLDWTRPTVLLLGNEGAGLAPELLAVSSHQVTIPHSGAVESLNVAVAAAPLLLERWRQLTGENAGHQPQQPR